MNMNLLEKTGLKLAMAPVDLNTAAVTGARISIQKGSKLAIIAIVGASTSATAVEFALKQHTAASGGTTAALPITNSYYHKLNTATKFTKVDLSAEEDTFDLLSLVGDLDGIVVFEVDEADLDEGYTHVSVNIADAGAAKLGVVLYALYDVDYKPFYAIDL